MKLTLSAFLVEEILKFDLLSGCRVAILSSIHIGHLDSNCNIASHIGITNHNEAANIQN